MAKKHVSKPKKKWMGIPATWVRLVNGKYKYMKGGKIRTYSESRDRKISSKHHPKKWWLSKTPYRGDKGKKL